MAKKKWTSMFYMLVVALFLMSCTMVEVEAYPEFSQSQGIIKIGVKMPVTPLPADKTFTNYRTDVAEICATTNLRSGMDQNSTDAILKTEIMGFSGKKTHALKTEIMGFSGKKTHIQNTPETILVSQKKQGDQEVARVTEIVFIVALANDEISPKKNTNGNFVVNHHQPLYYLASVSPSSTYEDARAKCYLPPGKVWQDNIGEIFKRR